MNKFEMDLQTHSSVVETVTSLTAETHEGRNSLPKAIQCQWQLPFF